MFVHLTDSARTVLTGWDNPPCRGTSPTHTWRAGEVIRDEYTLTLPDLPPGGKQASFLILAGMYDSLSGVPVDIANATGGKNLVPQPDHRLNLAEIRIARQAGTQVHWPIAG